MGNTKKKPATASGDHLVLLRCDPPERTKGGILLPDRARENNPVQFGRVLAIGEEAAGVAELHEVVVFDEHEVEAMDFRTKEDPYELVFCRKSAIRFRMSKEDAIHIGIDYPKLKNAKLFAEIAGLIN